jgi:hypothetical protein
MQNAAYEDTVLIRLVDQYMHFVFHAAISPPNPIAWPSDTWSACQLLKAAPKAIHIATGLL